MSDHEEVREALRAIRQDGAEIHVAPETDDKLIVSAETRDAENPKNPNKRYVENYRMYAVGPGGQRVQVRADEDPMTLYLLLKRVEFDVRAKKHLQA